MADALSADAPDRDPSLDWIWRAWHRLSDDRPRYGGGLTAPVPGRIPWTTIWLWCRHHRLKRGEMQLLDACFEAMDQAYVEWWISKQPKAGEP